MVTKKDMEDMIDLTRFQTVLNHLANDPDITGAINILDEDLASIGTLFVNGDVKEIEKMCVEGRILAITLSKPIDPSNAVDVLYLPPFYLFKDRGYEYK